MKNMSFSPSNGTVSVTSVAGTLIRRPKSFISMEVSRGELKFDGGFRVVRRGNVPHGPLLANSRSCHGFRMNCTNPAHSGRPVTTGHVNQGGAPSGRGN